MSFNPSRAEKNDFSQHRNLGRSGSSRQPRNNFSGSVKGGGGGTAPPSTTYSVNPSLSSSRSLKKSNNAQGGQSRVPGASINSGSNTPTDACTLQNGAHSQQPPQGISDAPVPSIAIKPTADMPAQKSAGVVPKDTSLQSEAVCSDSTTPATPGKSTGDGSRSFPLQFGSISPGCINGMQIPARTSSAPPNLDEQKRDQARHALRVGPAFPIPPVPKQQATRKNGDATHQSKVDDAHHMSKGKRDVQVPAPPHVHQTQKVSVHAVPRISMPIPFHQQQVPVQFGGPNPQIPSQTSMPMPMQLPLPIASASQLQQPVFISNLPPHQMQHQVMMHQGQSLNFTHQMGPQLPPQLGISIVPQFTQQQAGKFAGNRKPVKITHPKTHEEVRLDGSSGPRLHPSVPQSQSITSVSPASSISYYPSYNSGSFFSTAPSSVPLTNTQIHANSQPPQFGYPVSQSPQSVPFMKPSTHASYPSKNSTQLHGIAEPSATVQVTGKPGIMFHVEKATDSSLEIGSASSGKVGLPKLLRQPGHSEGSETLPDSSLQQPKSALEPNQSSMHMVVKQFSGAALSVENEVSNSLPCASSASEEEAASAMTSGAEGRRSDAISRSDSMKDQQKNMKKRHSQHLYQAAAQSTSILSLPSQSSQHNDSLSLSSGMSETADAKASSSTGEGYMEASGQQLCSLNVASLDAGDAKTDGAECMMYESSKEVGSSISVDNLNNEHQDRQTASMLLDEPLKLGSMGTKEQVAVLDAEPKLDRSNSETSSESISEKSSEVTGRSEGSCAMKVTDKPIEVNHEPQKLAQEFEENVSHHDINDVVAGGIVKSTPAVVHSTNAESTLTKVVSVGSRGDDKMSSSDASFSRSDSSGSAEASSKSAPVSTTVSVSESILKDESDDGTENVAGLVSLSLSGSKEKLLLELPKAKSTIPRGKKKMKEILKQKADVAEASDLYMAYKSPEEKREASAPSENTQSISSSDLQFVADGSEDDVSSSEKIARNKAEPDDWEDAADISTPKLEKVADGKQVYGAMKHDGKDGVLDKRYSRDFLMKFSEKYTDLPEGFEITVDIAEVLMVSNVNASRESYPSPGRIIDRLSGGSRSDRRGSGMGDDDKWIKSPGPLASGRDSRMEGYGSNLRPGQVSNYGVLRNPRSPAAMHTGGILSGPMQSFGPQGVIQRNNSDSERWQRTASFQKGLIPSPQTPLPVMHKAEKKYEVGRVADEEEAKQRQLKAILNKLTPQNFEKLFQQVKDVNINSAVTLTGVISQIFDKALMEPTFCEMYANFCYHLAGELPDFSEDNEKITFKRLLLNKCQEEFERGEREQEEANKADEEGEVKQTVEAREQKRILARRRMLGNIRLIGELYKKKMLTERIMHDCIKKLLGQHQNSDEEDIEALCKLMSTIGEMIDHPRAREHMDAYFDRMAKLSNNMKLSSRVRFMLKDAIDLRKNKWQQRRKVEGPKKIEEVHRDAAQERQVQAGRVSRGPGMVPSVRNRQPMDFIPRGSSMLSPTNVQVGGFRGLPTQRGYGTQDVRLDARHSFDNRSVSVPLSQRPMGDDSITLGPQGGLARGMSIRGQPSDSSMSLADMPNPGDSRRMTFGMIGHNSVSERTSYRSREDLMPRYMSNKQSSIQDENMSYGNRDLRVADHGVDRALPTSPTARGWGPISAQNVSSDKMWPDDRLQDMSIAAIKEFYSAQDEKEVVLCMEDLHAPSFYPLMISIWVTDSFERKDTERDLLAKLLINLIRSGDGMLNQEDLIKGFESVLVTLEDAVNDAPKAADFLGCILAKVIMENVVSFTDVGQLIFEGGEEQGRLVETGLAADVVATILETLSLEKGETVVNDIRSNSGLKLEKFRSPDPKKSRRLDKFI